MSSCKHRIRTCELLYKHNPNVTRSHHGPIRVCVCECVMRICVYVFGECISSANASHKEHKIFIYDALIIINHGMCYCNGFQSLLFQLIYYMFVFRVYEMSMRAWSLNLSMSMNEPKGMCGRQQSFQRAFTENTFPFNEQQMFEAFAFKLELMYRNRDRPPYHIICGVCHLYLMNTYIPY